jgi:hypothetical protein
MNDLRAAYDLSRAAFRAHDDETSAALAQGLYVAAATCTAHCRFTDAVLGQQYLFISAHPTREEAQSAANAYYTDDHDAGYDSDFVVLPRLPVQTCEFDDIPF